MSEDNRSLIRRLAQNPDLYPARVRVPLGDIEFCTMSVSSYRRSPFLDHRICRENAALEFLPFHAVRDVLEKLAALPTHYIFHNAFACSTLLTRYLDALDGPIILREPNSLYEVATLSRFEGMPIIRPLVGLAWDDLFRLVTRLIGRRYLADCPTIVKPTDGCNNLMPDLVRTCDGNRAVCIYAPFERFLASVLRHAPRHEWVKVRLRELLIDEYRKGGGLKVSPEGLDVPQSAALVWYLHTEQMLRCITMDDGARCLVIEADALVMKPEEIIWEVVRHFGLDHTQADVTTSVRNTNTATHAKAAHEVYDAHQREQTHLNAMDQFKPDVDRAANWLRSLNPLREPLESLPGAIH